MEINEDLIKASAKGERKAQFELYKACFSPLMNVCFRFASNKDDAAALLNDAFYKILTNLNNKDPKAVFIAWARRITINHCINEYRKDKTRKKYIEVTESETLENKSVVDEEEEGGKYSPETLALVREEIKNLPPTTQEVFQLFILEGYSHKEIAALMEISEGTSKWHVNNARKKLKELLKNSHKTLKSIAL